MPEFQDLVNMGYSEYTIAAKMGVSLAEVHRLMGKETLELVDSTKGVGRQGKPMTKEECEKIAQLIAVGTPIKDIAEQTGWAESTIWVKFKGRTHEKLRSAELDSIRELRSRGQSASEIAGVFQVSERTIQRALKQLQEWDREAVWCKVRESLQARGASRETIKQAYKAFLEERDNEV